MRQDATKRSKRYILCKKDGDSKRPCAFFNTPVGCRSGNSCPFSHGMTSTDTMATVTTGWEKKRKEGGVLPESIEKKPKVSSASNWTPYGNTQVHDTDKQPTIQSTFAHFEADTTPFVSFSPPGFSMSKLRNDEDSDDSQFLFSVVNTALTQGQILSPISATRPDISSISPQLSIPQGYASTVTKKDHPVGDFFLFNDSGPIVITHMPSNDHTSNGSITKRTSIIPPSAPKSMSQAVTPTISEYRLGNLLQPHLQDLFQPLSNTDNQPPPPVKYIAHTPVPSVLDRGVPIAPALFQAPLSSQYYHHQHQHHTKGQQVLAHHPTHPTQQHYYNHQQQTHHSSTRPSSSYEHGGGMEGWLSLVQHSLQAERYQIEHQFDMDSEWVSSKPFGDWY